MADFLIDINSFSQGLQVLTETTDAPIGSARVMTNMLVTDRGGISPRPGTLLYGTYNSDPHSSDGFYNYIKSGVETNIPVKSYNGKLEYYHPTLNDWCLLKSGYTPAKEFDFQEHLINTDNEDYLYGCNASEPYFRWPGSTAVTVGAYASGTTLTVDSTLKTTTYESGTGTASSATTLTDSSKAWASSQWVGFYVLITSGAQAGVITKISANTATQLTFDAITDPGNATYQIRMPKFPVSGKLTVGTTTVTYSAIPTSTTFTITDPGTALAANSPVTVQPTEFPACPRGNRLVVHHTRMIVGGVQSGMSHDAAGNLQGSQSTATVYVSKMKNASDFSFANPRAAGEGDLITAPYGGGNITDIVSQEDFFYVFKKYYIEADKYPTDNTSDIVVTTPLKQGFGSIGRAIKGRDDIYFVTADNQIVSIGRVQLKDTVPQTTNFGILIKRLIDTYDFTNVKGIEFKQRIFIACKAKSTDTNNNRVIVLNRQTKTFEGIWLLNVNAFEIINGDLYYAESTGPNVWKMFTGVNDTRVGLTAFPITAQWRSNWWHLVPRKSRFRVKPSQFQVMGINALGIQGYIRDGSKVTFSLFKDFSDTAALQFDFGNTAADQQLMQGLQLSTFLGDNPLGLEPIGSISDPDPSGDRHFKFIVYFPDIYANYLSLGVDSSGLDQYYEVTRFGVGTSEETTQDQGLIKDITTES